MIFLFPKGKNLKNGDLIVLEQDGNFIGYASVLTILTDIVLVKVDKSAGKVLNELYDKNIPIDFKMD